MTGTLDELAVRLDNAEQWPTDPGELYDAIIAAAHAASAAAQSATSAGGVQEHVLGVHADVAAKLGRVARGLADKLRTAADGLHAASWTVTVGWPPGIEVSVTWGAGDQAVGAAESATLGAKGL